MSGTFTQSHWILPINAWPMNNHNIIFTLQNIRDGTKKNKKTHILGKVSTSQTPSPLQELGTPYFDLWLNDSLFSPK